jgi:hypothetical protein
MSFIYVPFPQTTTALAFDIQALTPYTGRIRGFPIPFTNLVTTFASAGSAAALPATPQGYWTLQVDGVSRKIPFYPT